MFASGNGGSHYDSCAADGFVNSIYTIAVGSADQNGEQAYYDEDCSAKMAVTFSYNSNTSSPANRRTNQLASCNSYFPKTFFTLRLVALQDNTHYKVFCNIGIYSYMRDTFTLYLQFTTSLNGRCSDSFTGTSASAPLLSGVIALTLEAK